MRTEVLRFNPCVEKYDTGIGEMEELVMKQDDEGGFVAYQDYKDLLDACLLAEKRYDSILEGLKNLRGEAIEQLNEDFEKNARTLEEMDSDTQKAVNELNKRGY
jgi:hypothetical protein